MMIEGGPALDVQALAGERAEAWTGVTVAFDTLNLRIAAVDDRFGMIWAAPDKGGDVVELAVFWHCPVLITSTCFAYLTVREHEHGWEFGAPGHGSRGSELAHQPRDHVVDWNLRWRHRGDPDFILHPTDAAVPVPAEGRIWRKRHTQLEMAWRPETGDPGPNARLTHLLEGS